MKITTKTTTWLKPKSSTNEIATFSIFPIHWQITNHERKDWNEYMWRKILQSDASADPLHSWMQRGCVKFVHAEKRQTSMGEDCAFAYLPECPPTTMSIPSQREQGNKTLCVGSSMCIVHRTLSTFYNLLLSQWVVDAPTDTYLNWEQVLITFSYRWAFQRIRRKQPPFAFS